MKNLTYTNEESKALKVGMLISAIIFISVVHFTTQNSAVKQKSNMSSYDITAKFGRSDGLEIGDDVLFAGVKVGKVTNTKLDKHFQTIVTLSIDNIKIPRDSSASIESVGILSGKMISIQAGGDEEFLKPGESFSYTQDAMVIPELIERVVSMSKNKKGDSNE